MISNWDGASRSNRCARATYRVVSTNRLPLAASIPPDHASTARSPGKLRTSAARGIHPAGTSPVRYLALARYRETRATRRTLHARLRRCSPGRTDGQGTGGVARPSLESVRGLSRRAPRRCTATTSGRGDPEGGGELKICRSRSRRAAPECGAPLPCGAVERRQHPPLERRTFRDHHRRSLRAQWRHVDAAIACRLDGLRIARIRVAHDADARDRT